MKTSDGFTRWTFLIGGAVVIGLGIGFTLKFSAENQAPAADQSAKVYVEKTQPLVAQDPRFKYVEIYRFSAFGCVRLKGSVSTEAYLAALHQLIAETHPPQIAFEWAVTISRDDVTTASQP